MQSVNVLVSGVPGVPRTLCLQLGSVSQGVLAAEVCHALARRTGLAHDAFLLLCGGHIVESTCVVAAPGQRESFITLLLRRALPGGKGGFGATLRGAAARGRSGNFAACRDLEGRRLRDVQRARRAAQVAVMPTVVTGKRQRKEESEPQIVVDEVDVDEIVDKMDDTAQVVKDDVMEGLRAAREARKKRRKEKDGKMRKTGGKIGDGNMEIVAVGVTSSSR